MVGEDINADFVVSTFLDNDFLLGMPEMTRYNLVLNMGEGTISKGTHYERFIRLPQNIDESLKVWCKKTYTIPKDTSSHIKGILPKRVKHNVQGVSEPKDGLLQDKSLFIANALVYGVNGEIPLVCLNVSDQDITLKREPSWRI